DETAREERMSSTMIAARFIVWVNDVACRCRSLAAAQRVASRARQRGKDAIICSPHLRHTIYAFDAAKAAPSPPKRKMGRLLYFPLVHTPRRPSS
ncbi:MAG TPA: hypothetical protein VHQ67_02475, partial [Nitrospiraceae bacterium]|nr:hypothetical protein [Nitrospiraceae bacterium]